MNCAYCDQELTGDSLHCDFCGSWRLATEMPQREQQRNLGRTTAPGVLYADAPRVRAKSTSEWAPPSAESQALAIAGSAEAERISYDLDDDPAAVTRLSNRRMGFRFWALDLPDGTCEVIVGSVVVGRAPEHHPEWAVTRELKLHNPSSSLSKSHAVFTESAGSLIIRDLHSRNGVVVLYPDGSEVDLGRGGSIVIDDDCRVELGDVVVSVRRH